MNKIAVTAFALLLLGLAFAADEGIIQGKQLVDSNASCASLSDNQLDLIGDYYMEQLHPGEQHVWMENMMGGDGSAGVRLAHIQMALALYCGRTDVPLTYGGMMGMAPLMSRIAGGYAYNNSSAPYYGMMGGYAAPQANSGQAPYYRMMGGYAVQPSGQPAPSYQQPYGMMGAYGFGNIFGMVFWLLAIVAVILAIIWLYQQITSGKKGKR